MELFQSMLFYCVGKVFQLVCMQFDWMVEQMKRMCMNEIKTTLVCQLVTKEEVYFFPT